VLGAASTRLIERDGQPVACAGPQGRATPYIAAMGLSPAAIALLVAAAGTADERQPRFAPHEPTIAYVSRADGLSAIRVRYDDGRDVAVTDGPHDSDPFWRDAGRLGFVRDGHRVLEIELATGRVRELAHSDDALLSDCDARGGRLVCSSRRGERYALVEYRCGRWLGAVPDAGFRELYPRLDRDGRLYFFARRAEHPGDDEIYALDRGASASTRLTRRAGHDFAADVTRDGSRLAFVRLLDTTRRDIPIVDRAGGRVMAQVAPGLPGCTQPSFSHDATRLVLTCREHDRFRLVVVALDGGSGSGGQRRDQSP
jgi:hypothetical protein